MRRARATIEQHQERIAELEQELTNASEGSEAAADVVARFLQGESVDTVAALVFDVLAPKQVKALAARLAEGK
jgi:hypothetical protein